MPDVLDAVRDVVRGAVRKPVPDDQLLVSSGMIDSLSVLTLISALEERLKLRIPVADVQPDDFDSILMIVDTIARVASR
jgi:acyl carrier protein